VAFEGRKKLEPAPDPLVYVMLGVRFAPDEFWNDQYVPASASACDGSVIEVRLAEMLYSVEYVPVVVVREVVVTFEVIKCVSVGASRRILFEYVLLFDRVRL
jgi:hypothetical protein